MIKELIMYYALFVAGILVALSIVIGSKRTKQNEKLFYRMEKMDLEDDDKDQYDGKTRTGGLSPDTGPRN